MLSWTWINFDPDLDFEFAVAAGLPRGPNLVDALLPDVRQLVSSYLESGSRARQTPERWRPFLDSLAKSLNLAGKRVTIATEFFNGRLWHFASKLSEDQLSAAIQQQFRGRRCAMQIAQALYAYMSEEPALYARESWHAAAFMADVCQELNLRWCDCASRYLALARMFEALRTAMIKIDLAQRGTHKYEHAVLSECVLWKNAMAPADFVIMNGGIAGDDPAFSSEWNKHCEGGSCSVIHLDQVRALVIQCTSRAVALQLCHDMKENFDAR